MALLKRIKNLIALSKLHGEPDVIVTENGTEPVIRLVEDLGDGKAEFLGEGTTEEFVDQERSDAGMKRWYDKFKPKSWGQQ